MTKRYRPVNPKYPRILHGGDYNPEQWINTPEIWDEDMRLMKLANCNAMSIGIFSWSALEPAEGKFDFGWLDTIMDKLADHGAYAIMATPSAAMPAWMTRTYPEILRIDIDGRRVRHGGRQNHCRTSPVYRQKCRIINRKLAERYRNHPALLVWHASNEYSDRDCHCRLCHGAFREWLTIRYGNGIDRLNHAYWSAFWSHTFPDWSHVVPKDKSMHGLMLDWQRFKTAQTISFFKAETEPLKELTPDVPITTNFMTNTDTFDYFAFAKAVDVVSWDSYPSWHETGDDAREAAYTGFLHDICRSMKGGKPFMLMESTPSIPTRGCIKKRKEPGMHLLSSLQALAHGSDTVLYFQWRKSRGCMEKFAGAVVDHAGSEHTREFRETAEVGRALAKLDVIAGTTVPTDVAIILDWENEWALDLGAVVYLGENTKYRKRCFAHYLPFWEKGVPVDAIDQSCCLDSYKLVVAPMIYLLRPGFSDRLKDFVSTGGTAVMTYWSAVVDESDLCFLGGIPGDGLGELFGIREEESQSYFPSESATIEAAKNCPLKLNGQYTAVDTCSVIHSENAQVLARFTDEYFSGGPALTVNDYGKGRAYYIASRNEDRFLSDFYGCLITDLALKRAIDKDLPDGVAAQMRSDGETEYIFLMNFNDDYRSVNLKTVYTDVLTGDEVGPMLKLKAYGVMIIEKR